MADAAWRAGSDIRGPHDPLADPDRWELRQWYRWLGLDVPEPPRAPYVDAEDERD